VTDDAPAPSAQIPPEFLVNRQGSIFITYRGLIHLAHQQGLSATCTRLVQAPDAANGMTAIVTAQVTTEKGTFAGMGDANPANVPKMIQPHLLRMAETRALARALRVATDAAYTALEELGDDAPAPTAPQASAPPDVIQVEGRLFTRAQVWATYQQRRGAALAAGAVPPDDEVMTLTPDARLAYLVGAAQQLRRVLAPAPVPPEEPEP
jgi:hypothetical protein